jgi:exodeoxyribonuclease VII small subunit
MTEATPTFEEAISELEQIVRQMETGQLPLAESLAEYEKGISLIKHCHSLLKAGEQRVLRVTGTSADGQPCLEPFLDPS